MSYFSMRRITQLRDEILEDYVKRLGEIAEETKNPVTQMYHYALSQFCEMSNEYWKAALDMGQGSTEDPAINFNSILFGQEPETFMKVSVGVSPGATTLVNRNGEIDSVMRGYLDQHPMRIWMFLVIPYASLKWLLDNNWQATEIERETLNRFSFNYVSPDGRLGIKLTMNFDVADRDEAHMEEFSKGGDDVQ